MILHMDGEFQFFLQSSYKILPKIIKYFDYAKFGLLHRENRTACCTENEPQGSAHSFIKIPTHKVSNNLNIEAFSAESIQYVRNIKH
ncbi:UNVERIFIED_CONTAM: hypothetical protein NCL1_22586 [Trichonephila clavipes]